MHNRQKDPNSSRISGCASRIAGLFALLLCLPATGCLSSLQKHSAALSAATAPVIDEAATAYLSAQTLHNARVDFEAVAHFDDPQQYNPRTIVIFPDDQAIQVRLTVLEAFKCYVQSLVDITNGVDSPRLEAASAAVGASLKTFGNTLGPTAEGALGITPPTGTTTATTVAVTSGNTVTTTASTSTAAPPPLVSAASQNAISTAALALGEFLVSKKIKKELPQKIIDMDPKLEALCKILMSDIDILQEQGKSDYNFIITSQIDFVQGSKLDPQERRIQIMRLPEVVRRQRVTEKQFIDLRASLNTLYLTHRALATDAQGNNPKSLKARLPDLAAAGSDLGKFYSSLPTH